MNIWPKHGYEFMGTTFLWLQHNTFLVILRSMAFDAEALCKVVLGMADMNKADCRDATCVVYLRER